MKINEVISRLETIRDKYGSDVQVMTNYDGLEIRRVVGRVKTSSWKTDTGSTWSKKTEDAWRNLCKKFGVDASMEDGDETMFLGNLDKGDDFDL